MTMNKRLVFILPVLAFIVVISFYDLREPSSSNNILKLRNSHSEFLKQNAPGKDSGFSRLEKIQRGLPPNQYYELMEYLTMNPALGYPEPYKVKELHEKIIKQRKQGNTFKAPGESVENAWQSRGPNNVGGRTRVLMFDPNDETGKRVFAGAISGGLWINNDISRQNSTWSQVNGLPANLNISSITVDPRDPNIWYAGTGEQYTGGDVIGTGVYKTTDGGATWNKVLDVEQYASSGSGENALVVGGLYYINDIIAWDNGTATEIFIGVSTHLYANARNPTNFLGFFDRGLYSSVNGGNTWNKLLSEDSFNDFEVDAAGNLWVATTYSPGEGEDSRGGKIFKRDLGEATTFSQIATVPEVLRTEIEASATNPDKFYILAENAISEEAEMWITTDAFSSITPLNEPNDADLDIPPDDFARNQAFYNLMIESDPSNDAIVYAGGIDLFRSTNSGQTWQQISKWANNDNLDQLPVSLVHADHHVMQFRPGNTNQAVFGHDGGVSFARDLSAAATSDVFITPETNYITTQFYSIAVAPDDFASGDYFLGGTQDNGTQLIQNGDKAAIGVLGGDGAFAFYDQVNTDYFVANLVYNDLILAYDYSQEGYTLVANNEEREGFFINPQALDSNLDILYSNGPEMVLYRYDDLDNLALIGDDGITNNDNVAPRTSIQNALLDTSISAITNSPFSTNSSTVLLGLINGKLLRVENAEKAASETIWTELTGPSFVGSISDIEFGTTEDEIYVTFYNYGVKSIWYTKNATAANPVWSNKEGDLPDLPVLTILPNPFNKEEVIIGTELGVWTTSNFTAGSPTWTQSYNGMSDVKVTDLDLKKGTNEVYAASYGRGMFSGQFEAPDSGEEIPTENAPLIVYPTVSFGSYNILAKAPAASAEVYVFDIQGQLLSMATAELEENIPFQIDLAKEASGLYFLKVSTKTTNIVQKIIKK